jgi:hypothetical protein
MNKISNKFRTCFAKIFFEEILNFGASAVDFLEKIINQSNHLVTEILSFHWSLYERS